MKERSCRSCTYFPCLKPQCLINKEACNDYESIVQAEAERIMKEKWISQS